MDLKRRSVTGVIWSAGAKTGQQLLQFIIVAILARLLTPAEFGLVAMILVFSNFALLFAELGLGQAVVQLPKLDEAHRSSAFWLNVAVGALLTLLFAGLSPVLAYFYGEPALTWLSIGMSTTFLLGAPVVVQRALLQRQMNFRAIAVVEIVATLTGGLAAIAAALSGYGAWSLVVQLVGFTTARSALLFFMSSWRPRWMMDRRSVGDLWRFSGSVTGFNTLHYWSRNADNFIIAKVAGPNGLGLYSRAYNTMSLPTRDITFVLQQVMFPALSRIQDDVARVKKVYLKALGMIALTTFPITLGLLVAAGPFIHTLYGSQWTGAVPILQILCIAGLPQPLMSTNGWIYKSQGRTDLMLRWGIVGSVVTLSSFVLGILWGVTGVAWGYALATYIMLPINFSVSGRLIGMRLSDLAAVVWKPLVVASLMAVVVAVVDRTIPMGWSPWMRLIADIVSGGMFYVAVVHFARLESYIELRQILSGLRRRQRTSSAEVATVESSHGD